MSRCGADTCRAIVSRVAWQSLGGVLRDVLGVQRVADLCELQLEDVRASPAQPLQLPPLSTRTVSGERNHWCQFA